MRKATLEVTVTVPAEQADAFRRVVSDFRDGSSPQIREAERELRERADVQAVGVDALRRLYKVATGDSGQCRYIARFLASCYNGYRFPFDLTDFRGIDKSLFDDCMAVLAMDFAPRQEVHRYFEDGGQKWEAMIRRWGLPAEQLERAQHLVRDAAELP